MDSVDVDNSSPNNRNGEVCQYLGAAYTEYLPHLPYIPTSNDPVLTINVNLIFIAREDGTGAFVDIPEHVAIWNEIETNLNNRYSLLIEPSYTGDNSTCFDPYAPFVSNTKIQFNLNPVFLTSNIYNDIPQCSASSIRSVLQPFLDEEAPELSCDNSINVVMPTDYANLQDVINNGVSYTTCYNQNATFPSFTNLSLRSYAHFPNLYTKYVWMKTVIPGTPEYPQPWDPVIRFWFINSVASGLAHELGHNLGLHHFNAVHDLNTCRNSIMTQSGSPRNFLPPTEIGKIHRALAHSSVRNTVDVSSYSSNPIIINTNTTWDTDRKLYRPVVVESGATLTVTCQLLFHPDATIVVKQGGTLIVDGGTLTNYCDEMWKGIQVWGDSDKDQYPYSTGNYYQGRAIFINDALLENAWNGIQNWNHGHFDQIGGIIQAKNSTFRNCRRVAAFYSYQNTSPSNPQIKRPDLSYFELCKFENNDDYLADQNVNPPYAMVSLWETDRVRFSGCVFKNSATVNYSEARSKAIYSIDANYIVNSHCNDPYPSINGCQGIEKYCEFTGWYKAIQADGAVSSSRPISVNKSIFKENMIGIEIAGAEYSEIYKNEFELGDHPFITGTNLPSWQSHLGVFSNSTLNFAIEENDFERLASAPYDGHGVLVYNSKGSENVVYKNNFKNLKVGANGWQVNKNINFEGGVPAGQSGLQFLCNDNEGNEVDFEISRSGHNPQSDFMNAGIRQNQGSGSPQRPAGNIFSNPTADPSVYTHFTVSSVDIYGYFYRNNPPSYSEITPGKVSIQPQLTVNKSCPTNYPTGPVIIIGKSQLIGKISEFNALRYAYSQIIDDGNTQGMVSEIELAWSNDAWELRDELIARSPYNSEEVLIAAALKEIMPHAMLLEVLLENPEALRSGELIRKIDHDMMNPMPQYMIDLLWASRDQKTLRTEMESNLDALHFEVLHIQKEIIRNRAFADSTSNNPDSLIYYISRVKTVEANYERVGALADNDQYSASIALLDSMLNNYKFHPPRINECNALKLFYTYLGSAAANNQTVANLDANIIKAIKSIADSPDAGLAALKAQNLLCFHYQICYDLAGNPKSLSAPKKPVPTRDELISKLNTSNAYPSPANDYITISYNLLKAVESSKFIAFDGLGRQVENRILGDVYEGQELIDTRKIPNGVYLYQILQNGKKVLDGKFVVSH